MNVESKKEVEISSITKEKEQIKKESNKLLVEVGKGMWNFMEFLIVLF